MKNELKHFTRAEILQAIGKPRLAKFLRAFTDELQCANLLLPSPDSENGHYFDLLAALLTNANNPLPDRLRHTLLTLENAAAPENQARLDLAIQQRIPCMSMPGDCPMDCVLELWFAAPEELSQF